MDLNGSGKQFLPLVTCTPQPQDRIGAVYPLVHSKSGIYWCHRSSQARVNRGLFILQIHDSFGKG